MSSAHTFDRFVEFTQARKMIPQIIGTGAETFADLYSSLDPENDEWSEDEGRRMRQMTIRSHRGLTY